MTQAWDKDEGESQKESNNDIPNTEPENSLGAQNAKSNLLL